MQQVEPCRHRLSERLVVRVPRGLSEGVELAARAQLMSPAEYLRFAILKAVRADGVFIDGGTGKVEVRP
jgi:predicted HicB family RNase H-like nuclease